MPDRHLKLAAVAVEQALERVKSETERYRKRGSSLREDHPAEDDHEGDYEIGFADGYGIGAADALRVLSEIAKALNEAAS